MHSKTKKIFTFLEFDENVQMPAYIYLCLKTWQKYLKNDYKIVILNSKNIEKFISKSLLPDISKLKQRYPFPRFCDYIAALVLYENGGIFLDADTIITEKFKDEEVLYSHCDTVLYSNSLYNVSPGFMKANKGSLFMEELIRRYRFDTHLSMAFDPHRNYIINDVIKYFDKEHITLIDSEKSGYCMEKAMYGVWDDYLYQNYYFSSLDSIEDFLKTTRGITALRNSVTNKRYKEMDVDEFLSMNFLLAKIFKVIL